MARCGDCNKFVSYDFDEPELTTEDFNYDEDTGEVTFDLEIRKVLSCGECGSELRETTFMFDQTLDTVLSTGLDKDDIEMTVEVENDEKSEGKGRGMKMFYGVQVTVTLTKIVSGQSRTLATESFDAFCQASHYDEI